MSEEKICFDYEKTILEHEKYTNETNFRLFQSIKNSIPLKNIKEYYKHQQQINIQEETFIEKSTSFYNYRNKICLVQKCPYRYLNSLCCTSCILNFLKIMYEYQNNTLFYYFYDANLIYLRKDDFFSIPKLLRNKIKIYGTHTFNAPLTLPIHEYIPTYDELKALFALHYSYLINIGFTQNKSTLFIRYSITYKVIATLLSNKICKLYSLGNTLSEKDFLIFKENFDQYLYNSLQININEVTLLKKILDVTKKTCQKQYKLFLTQSICFEKNLPKNFFQNKPAFYKLVNVLYTLSNGDIKIIKQLSILLTKIFLSKKIVKKFFKGNDDKHLTLISSINPHYINDFLCDIMSYVTSARNIDYKTGKYQVIANRKYIDNPQLTKHSTNYLIDKENIPNLFKEKILGNILNIDSTRTNIDGKKFHNLLNGITVSIKSDALPQKINYRSNAHYIKLYNLTDNIPIVNLDSNSYDLIVCTSPLLKTQYTPLDAYELLFLVTGFLEYGLELLFQNTNPLNSSQIKTNHIPNIKDIIIDFISKFYIDTFSLNKAHHIQKNDLNDFIDIDKELYPAYKKWFLNLYNEVPICSNKQFKSILRVIYAKRNTGKALQALTKQEQTEELKHRYFKHNLLSCCCIYGLKPNEFAFKNSLNYSQQPPTNLAKNRETFSNFMNNLFQKYSPYNDEEIK